MGKIKKKVILEGLRKKTEIDYEKCSSLLFKLISQLCEHYKKQHGVHGMQNINMMYKRDISNKIYTQMMHHFIAKSDFFKKKLLVYKMA